MAAWIANIGDMLILKQKQRMDAMESKIQYLLRLLESVALSYTWCHSGARDTDGIVASATTTAPITTTPASRGFEDMTAQMPDAGKNYTAGLQSDE